MLVHCSILTLKVQYSYVKGFGLQMIAKGMAKMNMQKFLMYIVLPARHQYSGDIHNKTNSVGAVWH